MKILYVTPLVAGFEDIIKGEKESKGLPSFIEPLKALIAQGNIVDIILVSNYSGKIDIQVDWISNENILANINGDMVNGSKIKRVTNKINNLLTLRKTLKKALKYGNYDFVYCHGTAALLANFMANKYKISCGYRLYGTVDLNEQIRSKGRIKTAINKPVHWLIFNVKKKFMLITNDGTYGDDVYNHFCWHKKYPLFFWTNGIDKSYDESKSNIETPLNDYIFHAARIERVKRQDRNILVLKKLHDAGYKIHFYYAGHISDQAYFEELCKMVQDYQLEDYVHYMGAIERADMQKMSSHAVSMLLLADITNKGNVFLETSLAGALIITYKESEIEKYIINKKNGLLVTNTDEAVELIIQILNGNINCIDMKDQIKRDMNYALKTWDERVDDEIKLILDCVNND